MGDRREPILNLPASVTATLIVLFAIHAVRDFALASQTDRLVLLLFAFVPARFDPSILPGGGWPGGAGAEVWTFVTYALLHGSWTHLIFNSIWLLPFGSALARRFGALRFAVFLAATAAAGALVHLCLYRRDGALLIGASAAVSGTMAATVRFAFQKGGPLGMLRGDGNEAFRVPAEPFLTALRNPSLLWFFGIWFGLNALEGLGALSMFGEAGVAWEAHIGGFLAGLVLFALLDPVPAASSQGRGGGGGAAPTHT